MSRQRRCSLEDSDGHCRGEKTQRQQCYSTACPGNIDYSMEIISDVFTYVKRNVPASDVEFSVPSNSRWLLAAVGHVVELQ